jgi:hypothetical protein
MKEHLQESIADTEGGKSRSPAGQSPAPPVVAVSTTPGGSLLVQGKSGCACGGGCPRCEQEGQQIQPKLTVSTPGDVFEREADHVADQIMRMPDPGLQRQRNDSSDTSAPSSNNEEPQIRRQVNNAGGNSEVASDFTSRLGAGAPLDAASRSCFEPRFGQDFGSVRIHDGPEAATAADRIQARAFTVGRDVAFAAGQYDPSSEGAKRLLAHELTHVVQQSGAGGKPAGEKREAVSVSPAKPMIQGDFWSSMGRGWEVYSRLSDVGAPFAQELVRWRVTPQKRRRASAGGRPKSLIRLVEPRGIEPLTS